MVTANAQSSLLPARPWRAHMRALLSIGFPLIGAQLAQMAINATDIAMVGRLGVAEIGATAIATQYFFFFYIFGSGFLMAVTPLAAAAFGADEIKGIRRAARMGFWIALGFAILVTPALLASRPVLAAFGQDATVIALTEDYLSVGFAAMFPALLFVAFRSYLSAIDRAGILLWASVAAVLLNAALNWVFIYGNLGAPMLGVRGAAIASLGTNLFLAATVIVYALRNAAVREHDLFVRLWRPDWHVMIRILALGLPISLTILAEVGLFQAATLMAGTLGPVPLAAHSIVLQIASFAFMIPYGLSGALTARIGSETGARRPRDVRRVGISGLTIAALWSGIATIVFIAFPTGLIAIFLKTDDPDFPAIVATGTTLLLLAAAFQTVDGLQTTAAGALRGIADTRVPMLIAVASYWLIGLPVTYLLGFTLQMGVVGIWIGLAIGLAVACVGLLARLDRLTRMAVLTG